MLEKCNTHYLEYGPISKISEYTYGYSSVVYNQGNPWSMEEGPYSKVFKAMSLKYTKMSKVTIKIYLPRTYIKGN